MGAYHNNPIEGTSHCTTSGFQEPNGPSPVATLEPWGLPLSIEVQKTTAAAIAEVLGFFGSTGELWPWSLFHRNGCDCHALSGILLIESSLATLLVVCFVLDIKFLCLLISFCFGLCWNHSPSPVFTPSSVAAGLPVSTVYLDSDFQELGGSDLVFFGGNSTII